MKTLYRLTLVVVGMSCSSTAVNRSASPGTSLSPVDTLRLATPAAGICRDGDALLVLESAGERVLEFSNQLVPGETLPLTKRVAPARGIDADRFYVYVYDDQTMFRMSKEKLELSAWLGNLRVSGMASYAPGEMLVSDAERGFILYKTVFGESRRFLDAADVSRPGALATLPDGQFCAVSGSNRLVFFNRSAVVLRSAPLPGGCDLLAADDRGGLYLVRRGVPVLWVIRNTRASSYELTGAGSPSGLALTQDRIAILDADTRLLTYALP